MKIIPLFITSLLLIQCSDNMEKEYHVEAIYSSIPITIDGKLDEIIWVSAKPITLIENRTGNVVDNPQLITRVMTCYNDSTLYVAFICNDPDIWTSFTQRDEHLWEEEAVEVFIDVDDVQETYVEIEVSPANVLFDSYIVDPEKINVVLTSEFDLPGIMTGVNVNGSLNKRDDKDSSWTVEIAIPFRDLINKNTKLVTNKTEMRINFYRLDNNKEMEEMSYAWSRTGGRFHKPSVFGKVIFN